MKPGRQTFAPIRHTFDMTPIMNRCGQIESQKEKKEIMLRLFLKTVKYNMYSKLHALNDV